MNRRIWIGGILGSIGSLLLPKRVKANEKPPQGIGIKDLKKGDQCWVFAHSKFHHYRLLEDWCGIDGEYLEVEAITHSRVVDLIEEEGGFDITKISREDLNGAIDVEHDDCCYMVPDTIVYLSPEDAFQGAMQQVRELTDNVILFGRME